MLRVEDAKVALDKVRAGKEPVTLSKRAVVQKVKRSTSKRSQRGGLFADEDVGDTTKSALELLEKWDDKTKEQLLRSMPDFRPCPHCSGNGDSKITDANSAHNNANETSTASNKGGGFVTPECLAPINEERESAAAEYVKMAGPPSATAVLLAYAIYYFYCGSTEFINPAVQLIVAMLPSLLLPILPHALRLWLATLARSSLMRPIIVMCPCCNKEFNLDASSELQLPDQSSDGAADTATQQWKSSNTRPCPGCSSPILKDGGCNHVKCGKCKLDFCWGCMRARSSCRAYKCNNGSPYGNAFGDGSMSAIREGLQTLERERQGRTLVDRIDYIETEARRQLTFFLNFPWQYASLIAFICYALYGIFNSGSSSGSIGRTAIHWTLSLAQNLIYVFLLSIVLVCVCLFMHALRIWIQDQRNRHSIANRGADFRRQQNRFRRTNNLGRRRPLSFRQSRFRTDEEQIAEAIQRSLADQ